MICFDIHAGEREVVLQAHPRRGHLGHDRQPLAREIAGLERGIGLAGEQEERIAADRLAERERGAGRVLLERNHEPQRPAPRYVALPGDQGLRGMRRVRRHLQVDLQPLVGVCLERDGRVERRVEDGAEVFDERYSHTLETGQDSDWCCRSRLVTSLQSLVPSPGPASRRYTGRSVVGGRAGTW